MYVSLFVVGLLCILASQAIKPRGDGDNQVELALLIADAQSIRAESQSLLEQLETLGEGDPGLLGQLLDYKVQFESVDQRITASETGSRFAQALNALKSEYQKEELVSCALGFSWTLDCERVLAGGVSRWGNQIKNRRRRRKPEGRPETPPRGPQLRAREWPAGSAAAWRVLPASRESASRVRTLAPHGVERSCSSIGAIAMAVQVVQDLTCRPRRRRRPSPSKECWASRTARRSRSPTVSVTLRNRSDCTPTRPTIHVVGPLAITVSTRIGSLNRGPVRTCPGAMGSGSITILNHSLSVDLDGATACV